MSTNEVRNFVNTGYESDDDIAIIDEVFHPSSPGNTTILSSGSNNSDKERGKKRKSTERNENNELFVCGFYTCVACDVVIETQQSYEKHITHWKHKNNVKKLKTRSNGAAERTVELEDHADHESSNISSTPIRGIHSKYPSIPNGVIRRQIKDESEIQSIVERRDFPPCPGLEKVIEIRGLKQRWYFCELCNITCQSNDILSHLKGQKHQLSSLEALCPNEFKKITLPYTSDMKHHISSLLRYIQEKEGIGRIVVEKEYLDNRRRRRARLESLDPTGTSSDEASTSQVPVLSDATKSEYYCSVCECDLRDVNLWKSHSKSHKFNKNVKRYPPERAPKSVAEPMSKNDCFLMDGISDKDNTEPLVGLDFIREMQHIDVKKETYHCFLCNGCFTFLDISLHIKSQNHRINYIKYINHESLDVVRCLDKQANKSYYIVTEICRKIEQEIGSGHPEVYAIKNP